MSEIGKSFPNAPFKTFQQAFDYLNRYHWNLEVRHHEAHWNLWAGDQHMFHADSNNELEAFVLGMALTFSMILPEGLPGFEPSGTP
jgi:hypothetical protein